MDYAPARLREFGCREDLVGHDCAQDRIAPYALERRRDIAGKHFTSDTFARSALMHRCSISCASCGEVVGCVSKTAQLLPVISCGMFLLNASVRLLGS